LALEDANKASSLHLSIEELLSNKTFHPEMLRLLGELKNSTKIADGSQLETKREDPSWFKGVAFHLLINTFYVFLLDIDLGRSFVTKNQYMRENARRRIRSYWRAVSQYGSIEKFSKYCFQASDFCKRNKKLRPCDQRELKAILQAMLDMLSEHDEYSDYFARDSFHEDVRLCDPEGWFRCEGVYDCTECCFEHHRINPYASKHQRVLFSTWNLDHG
jgi:hypothetical protein